MSKNQYAIIDPDDYQKLSQYNWQIYQKHAVRFVGRRIINMHREIINAPAGKLVDHIDRNGLNNTKKNLRLATFGENKMNCGKISRPTSSKYKGVSFAKRAGTPKWRAYIDYNRTRKNLGYFETEEQAARVYDQAAKKYHGEFAALNFE